MDIHNVELVTVVEPWGLNFSAMGLWKYEDAGMYCC